MLQKQISVFIENKRGRLAEVTKVLGDNGVDLAALCIADTTDFGILRVIVDKPDLAEKVLKEGGFAVSITEVIALSIDDKPGGLATALRVLEEYAINIEYMYAYVRKNSNKATVIVRVDKPSDAIEKLKDSSVSLMTSADLQNSI
ncbi:MAG: acetolactate synthase [Clostridiales bacterium]|jgi:hypothetical protein|nr:acetolactate synthase [Clostridiales bacterium]